jgi:hypothetical protein
MPNTCPIVLQDTWLPATDSSGAEHPFVMSSRSILRGDTQAKGPASRLRPGTSFTEMESILTTIATAGNSDRPVAARLQSHPSNVSKLVGDAHSLAAQSATRGVAYRFTSRPKQWHRPRPLQLEAASMEAAAKEIDRLHVTCKAIERCEEHDGDKCLRLWATHYERKTLPRGQWPKEHRVPVMTSEKDVKNYNAQQTKIYRRRKASGLPRRDFESGVFTVSKSDGGHRLCTDYRELNKFAEKQKFQMEGVQEVAEMIQRGDYGMIVDLKDAYLTLGLHPSHRKYCRFRCPKTHARYQWKTVSFGTSEAPKLCTKILRPLIGILKSLGIRCLIYIDDLLLLDQDPLRLARAMAIAMELLQVQVGLQLKLSKGNLYPSQVFTCLGIIWDTTKLSCHIPAKRIKALQGTARRLLKISAPMGRESTGRSVPTRDLARFVGQVVSTSRAIRPAKRRLLFIQHALSKAVRKKGWNGQVFLSPNVRRALEWWTSEEPWKANGNDILPPVKAIQLSLRTDAATHNAGYGGEMIRGQHRFQTRGFLTEQEQKEVFINQFEFAGFENCLWALLPQAVPKRQDWKNTHISVELDNVTSIKYGRVAVSRSIRMSLLGAKFFDKVEEAGISLTFQHLAGEDNTVADELSRRASSHADWQLDRQVFRQLQRAFRVSPDVDLFASSRNKQVASFFTYHYDHRARGVDAFQHSWSNLGVLYAYPPPILLGKVLQKLIVDCCHCSIVVLPLWMAQTWFPTMLSMMMTPPILLPNQAWLVTDQLGAPAWPKRWPLVGCYLSGDMARARESRRMYSRSVGKTLKMGIRRDMMHILNHFWCGGTVPALLLNAVHQQFAQDC